MHPNTVLEKLQADTEPTDPEQDYTLGDDRFQEVPQEKESDPALNPNNHIKRPYELDQYPQNEYNYGICQSVNTDCSSASHQHSEEE